MDTSSTNYPSWMSRDLPDFIIRLDDEKSKEYLDCFSTLTEDECHKGVSLPWPIKNNFKTVAVQDGFDLSTINSANLERFFNRYSSTGVVFWATHDLKAGVYKANYTSAVRDWISSEFILSPVSMVAIEAKVVVVINEQLSFTLIGAGDEEIIFLESLYESIGGMKRNFINSLNDYYRDSNNSDYKWVSENVLPFCSWG